MAANGTLLMRTFSAVGKIAEQERPTNLQASKRPVALHEVAQGLHTQRGECPAGEGWGRRWLLHLPRLARLGFGQRLLMGQRPLLHRMAQELTGRIPGVHSVVNEIEVRSAWEGGRERKGAETAIPDQTVTPGEPGGDDSGEKG